MNHISHIGHARAGWFGHRKLIPRACIADSKKHLRTFLADALEDLGFITSECGQAADLDAVLEAERPDLLVLGVSVDGIEVSKILETLVRNDYGGKVLVIGQPDSIIVKAVRQVGDEYGIAMLPALPTPFSAGTLRQTLASLMPVEPAPSPAVDVPEALKAGWLELWYQQKIHLRTLAPNGAEALIRMRHPAWGVVPPAYFIPDESDPHFHALSEFVIGRAVEDWRYLVEQKGPVDLSINLPISFLADPDAVHALCRQVPDHPAFAGLLIEIDSGEIIDNLDLAIEVARRVRLHNIAISIDNVGANWPSLLGLPNFPFVELKVDHQFVTGCADQRLKQTVCRRIVELAHDNGARVVAQGIETRADFLAAHDLDFDLVQGYLFGKPMGVKKFARSRLQLPAEKDASA
ncbi:EAL domain-containing response regulator [Bradyrhizobium sp. WSM 1704]|uniref:EAL domain-containing response regulator n=1 Tax=Bradyrhizobium semiaridum TaxID=2821404 RepID=UPI001CE2CE24|nr:EAL domain-containing response regulator [Bradyrhizobium semiaridum]MCA6125799.1 EAL domain-containing response regulator [Bradyrhizobium semiaridum]